MINFPFILAYFTGNTYKKSMAGATTARVFSLVAATVQTAVAVWAAIATVIFSQFYPAFIAFFHSFLA